MGTELDRKNTYRESDEQAGLAHTGVANQEHLEEIVAKQGKG